MIYLNILCEGQTEEMFVKKLLEPHLIQHGVHPKPVVVFNNFKRKNTGGMSKYAKSQKHLKIMFRQGRRAGEYFTTLFDLYQLPKDFPGYDEAKRLSEPYIRVARLEDALKEDLDHPAERFIPYIQLHEFESLLFAETWKFAYAFPGREAAVSALGEIKNQFGNNPELINDGVETAPSKRILSLFQKYVKTLDGPIILMEIGIDKLKAECLHFGEWIEKLEKLNG